MIRILSILFLLATPLFATADEFDELLAKGKEAFKQAVQQPGPEGEYKQVIDYLEQAVALQPDNTEARYFLGFAYSKYNFDDGRYMVQSDVQLTMKASREFEEVIRLTPKYTGEEHLLDPYSKLTSEWGSLAFAYCHRNKPDSAVWALNEGKKRGGFSPFWLELQREALDYCSKNAILFSYGDNSTYAFLYLQLIEKHRTDVAVVDLGLINTTWYTAWLEREKIVEFGLPLTVLDTLEYQLLGADSLISVPIRNTGKAFSWTIPLEKEVVYRGDRLFIHLLQHNRFNREIYCIPNEDISALGLDSSLVHTAFISRLSENYPVSSSTRQRELLNGLERFGRTTKFINHNSTIEASCGDNFRYWYLMAIVESIQADTNKRLAKQLFAAMKKNIPVGVFPYKSPEMRDYIKALEAILE